MFLIFIVHKKYVQNLKRSRIKITFHRKILHSNARDLKRERRKRSLAPAGCTTRVYRNIIFLHRSKKIFEPHKSAMRSGKIWAKRFFFLLVHTYLGTIFFFVFQKVHRCWKTLWTITCWRVNFQRARASLDPAYLVCYLRTSYKRNWKTVVFARQPKLV